MTTRLRVDTLGVALAGCIAATAASAATLCVSPAGGSCSRTIQAAIDAAAPGDTIRVFPGTYYENVTVPAGKDLLQIVGTGVRTTILDASPQADQGNTNTGIAIAIEARKVQLRTLTIRNGENEAVRVFGSGALIQGLRINGANGSGVRLEASALGGQVVGNDIRNTNVGILAYGFGTLVKANVITATSSAIDLVGDASQALGNRIVGADFGIVGNADGLVVRSNDIQYASAVGIFVDGSAPVVQGNRIASGRDGISATCSDCFSGLVASNVMTGMTGLGILAASDAPGLVVERNSIVRAGRGLVASGTAITVRQNRVSDIGLDRGSRCFEVTGSLSTLSGNTATRCSGPGYYLNGNEISLDGNQATSTFENGFTVDGYNGVEPAFSLVSLTRNRASLDAGQGFALINGANFTSLTGNVGVKNRTDYCDDGANTILSVNSFGTTAATAGVDCVIAH